MAHISLKVMYKNSNYLLTILIHYKQNEKLIINCKQFLWTYKGVTLKATENPGCDSRPDFFKYLTIFHTIITLKWWNIDREDEVRISVIITNLFLDLTERQIVNL